MKFNKIFSAFLLLGLISFQSNAETVSTHSADINLVSTQSNSIELNTDDVKSLLKKQYPAIFNQFEPTIAYLSDAKLYEINFANQKAYTDKDVNYLYLQGQLFVNKNGQIFNLTMSPEDYIKSQQSNKQTASNEIIKPTLQPLPVGPQKTYENQTYDNFQKSILNSKQLEDLKLAANFPYVTTEGGTKIPETSIDYVKNIDLSNSLKLVYGNGERAVILFADPDCPYCQNFEKTLSMNADGLNATIYILPWTLSIHPNSAEKANFIWGQPDKGNAWKSWMLFAGKHIGEDEQQVWNAWLKESGRDVNLKGQAPIESTKKLIEEFGLQYTPTVLFPNGAISEGDKDALEMKKYLDVSEKQIPTKK